MEVDLKRLPGDCELPRDAPSVRVAHREVEAGRESHHDVHDVVVEYARAALEVYPPPGVEFRV